MKSYASSKTASRTVAESYSTGIGEVGKEAEGGHLGGGEDGDECISHLCGRESKKKQNKRKNRAVVGHREKVETNS